MIAALLTAAIGLAGASSAEAASDPTVAVQPDGTASFAFTSGEPGSAHKIGVRRWPSGASLAGPQFLSPGGSGAAEIAVNAAGQAAVVWTRNVGSDVEVEGRRREADGTLGPVHDLTPAETSGSRPLVAIAPDGSALFVYERITISPAIVGRRLSADGVLGPTKILSPLNYGVGDPAIAMDGEGNAIVTWFRRNVATDEFVPQARRVAADGSLGVIKTLAPASFDVSDTQVGIDDAGRATIAWLQHDGTFTRPRLSVRAANGTYSPVKDLLTASPDASDLRLAVNGAGEATVGWIRDYGATTKVLEMRRRAADGTLGATIKLSSFNDDAVASLPQVAMTPQGGSYAVWRYQDEEGTVIQGRRRSSGGVLGTIQQLSADGQLGHDPDVAVDGNGHATATWISTPPMQAAGTAYARRHAVGYVPAPIQTVSG